MTTFARIQGGFVAELFTPPDDVDIADCFPSTLAATFLEVPDGITPASGWTFDGKVFSAPVPQEVVSFTPLLTGRQIMGQVKAAGASAALVTFLGKTSKPDDVLYWYGIGLETLVPSDNPKVGRVLTGAGVTNVAGFMTAALALVA